MAALSPLFSQLPPDQIRILNKLERQRKQLFQKKLAWILLVPASIVFGVLLYFLLKFFGWYESAAAVVLLLPLLFLVACALWISFFFPEADDMNAAYRFNILPFLVKKVLPGWTFAPEHHLSIDEIVGTGLFKDRANEAIKENCFSTDLGKINAKIFEINLRLRALRTLPNVKGSPGGYEEEITNRFYGYFYFLSPVTPFSAKCWIFPRAKKARYETDDWLMITENSFEHEGTEKISTGHDLFDKTFVVFSENSIATKQQLSPMILESFLQAESISAGACAFAISGKSLFCMTGFEDDPLDVVKGLRVTNELESDHESELLKMKKFTEILAAPFSK